MPAVAGKKRVRLCYTEQCRVAAYLRRLCCSEAWIDAIMAALRKGSVRFRVNSHGRLRTPIADLMLRVSEAGLYPPPADDGPKYEGRTETHIGSAMRPCLSRSCTTWIEDVPHSILYPAEYAKAGRCFTCHINRTTLHETAAELGFTVSAFASPSAVAIRTIEYLGLPKRRGTLAYLRRTYEREWEGRKFGSREPNDE